MRIYLILSGIRWITVWSGLNLLAERKRGQAALSTSTLAG